MSAIKAKSTKQTPTSDTLWTWEHGFKVLDLASLKEKASEKRKHPASIGIKPKSRQAVIQTLKKGLPIAAFERLQKALDVPGTLLAEVVNIAGRTMARRKKEGRLNTDESERLWRLGTLFDRAIEVLGDLETARHWFKSPKKALGGQTPLAYADTEPGAREVEDLLGRLEYGVFS